MPTECAASSNWSTAFTSARDFPAAFARRRSGASWWLDGEHITVHAASDECISMDFGRKCSNWLPESRKITHFFIRKSLKSNNNRSGIKIANSKVPVMLQALEEI